MFDLLIFGFNNGSLYSLNVNGKLSKKKLTEKLTVLEEEEGVCLFDENLREINVSFKIRRDVSVILINLRGGRCNFPKKK
jgi:hypothetical protein